MNRANDPGTRRADLERRLEEFRHLMRARHAGVEPPPEFAAQVAVRLPDRDGASLAWAVWRLLPLSIAVLLVLLAVTAVRQPPAGAASSSTVASARTGELDALSWLLERGEGSR